MRKQPKNSDPDKARNCKDITRLLRLLSRNTSCGLKAKPDADSLVFESRGKSHTISLCSVSRAKSMKWVDYKIGGYRITPEGRIALERMLGLSSGMDGQPGALKKKPQRSSVNQSESPLARLYARKTGGASYISDFQFEAGERLRSEFEIGQLQPRLTANPALGLAGNSGKRASSGSTDLSDFALDARKRVNDAIKFLGPELSGVALDICCFLKGFEQVERERQWPPRSAKLMLRTALSRLEEHYGMTNVQSRKHPRTHFWGADDFRPALYSGQN